MTEDDRYDDELLDELGRALGAGTRVPDAVLEAAKAAYSWRTVDAELAALSYDSLVDDELAGVRGEAAPVRTLSFESAALVVELGINRNGLVGQLVPPRPGTITLRQHDGDGVTVPVDDLGCFLVRPAPTGPFSLRVRTGGDVDVVTDWVSLHGE